MMCSFRFSKKRLTSPVLSDGLGQASPNGGPRSGSGPSDGPIRTHDQFKIIKKKIIIYIYIFFFNDFSIQSMIMLVKSFLTEIQIERQNSL